MSCPQEKEENGDYIRMLLFLGWWWVPVQLELNCCGGGGVEFKLNVQEQVISNNINLHRDKDL